MLFYKVGHKRKSKQKKSTNVTGEKKLVNCRQNSNIIHTLYTIYKYIAVDQFVCVVFAPPVNTLFSMPASQFA